MYYNVKDFEEEVVRRSIEIPVLVDFWAEWCGPCIMLSPVLERLSDKHKGQWELKKLNTEEFPDLAAQYEIRSIPNVKLFSKGTVINEFVGALPESSIELWLSKALPDPYAGQLDQAESLIQKQQYDDAKLALEPILTISPDHERTRALLGLSIVFTDRARAVNLVANVDEASEYADFAEAIRTLDALLSRLDTPGDLAESAVKPEYLDAIKQLSTRNFAKAIDEFIAVIRSDRYYDNDGSRKACIAIFKLLGENHTTTTKYRREFGNALYA